MNAEAILANFASGVAKGRSAHAYLVNGPVRGGSADLTERMVQNLLCERGGNGCGECKACLKVSERTHPDMVWIEPRMKSRRISVEEVRDIQSLVYQTSYMGDWKVCVIAGADRMTREAANALLKSLEEPPDKSMFILLAENPQYLLPTIISRCQRFDLSVQTGPEGYEWYDELAGILMNSCKGTIGRMVISSGLLALLKRLKKEIQEAEESAPDAGEVDEKVMDARVSARYREERSAVLRVILLWYRDILLCAAGGEDNLYHKRYAGHLSSASRGLSLASATANISVIESMADLVEKNLGEEMVFMDGFMRLVEAV